MLSALNNTTAAQLPIVPVAWLWPGVLPANRVTLLAGEPGVGRSFLACDIAARLTSGSPRPATMLDAVALPPFEPFSASRGPRETLLLCAEDDPFDVLRPRLEQAGGAPVREANRRLRPGEPRSDVFPVDS